MQRGLTFSDVALIPQFNNVNSRTEPDLSTWLTQSLRIEMPLIPANMESVISIELADVIEKYGGYPIFHRFYSNENYIIDLVKKYKGNCFLSVGINDYEKVFKKIIHNNISPLGFVIDIAHGHDIRVMKAIEKMSGYGFSIIAGNVCSPMAYQDLVNAGASAIKVGIGPGAACTTRAVTGFGVPQFTAIQQCAEVAKKLKVPIIADGGIKSSRDCVLALAAGATSVMIGSLFAATLESAAPKNSEKTHVIYRGQASKSFQEDYYGELKKGIVPEGEKRMLNITGTASELIEELLGGIRSGLTYGGARNIKELQMKAEFIEVTQSYHRR